MIYQKKEVPSYIPLNNIIQTKGIKILNLFFIRCSTLHMIVIAPDNKVYPIDFYFQQLSAYFLSESCVLTFPSFGAFGAKIITIFPVAFIAISAGKVGAD